MTAVTLRITCKTDRLTVILSFVHTVILSEAKDLLLYWQYIAKPLGETRGHTAHKMQIQPPKGAES